MRNNVLKTPKKGPTRRARSAGAMGCIIKDITQTEEMTSFYMSMFVKAVMTGYTHILTKRANRAG